MNISVSFEAEGVTPHAEITKEESKIKQLLCSHLLFSLQVTLDKACFCFTCFPCRPEVRLLKGKAHPLVVPAPEFLNCAECSCGLSNDPTDVTLKIVKGSATAPNQVLYHNPKDFIHTYYYDIQRYEQKGFFIKSVIFSAYLNYIHLVGTSID